MSLFFFIRWRKERESMEMMEMADVSHQPLSHYFGFRVTLSHNFDFHDKVPSLEEIDWAQALTWFARTFLPLVVGMARVSICSGGSDGESWFHRYCSCSILNLAVLTLWDSFLKAGLGKVARVDDVDDEVSMLLGLLAICSRWRICVVISSSSYTSRTRLSGCLGCVFWLEGRKWSFI